MQSSNNQENPNPNQEKPISETQGFHGNEAGITAAGDQEDDEEEEELGFEFSFMADEAKYPSSPISAEEAFVNGQIKPAVQFNGRDLTTAQSPDESVNLPSNPPVKNVFFELSGEGRPSTDVEEGGDDGVYAVTSSPTPSCKKSNSTGFSRIWRFSRDFAMGRSHSDGRDAFVFLNEGRAPPCGKAPAPAAAAAAAAEEQSSSKPSSAKIKEAFKKKKKKGKKEGDDSVAPPPTVEGSSKGKGKKVNSTSLSAYMRRKADEKRRSTTTYLPYRPGLMGFFTNVSGGVSKNVHHPF